jgi:hypothetical protein
METDHLKFIIYSAHKNIHVNLNFIKCTKDLYTENYKMLMRDVQIKIVSQKQ